MPHVQEQAVTSPSSAAPGRNHTLRGYRVRLSFFTREDRLRKINICFLLLRTLTRIFSLSLHHERMRGKAEMAAQWMFSSKSDSQESCLSVKGGSSISQRHTATPQKIRFSRLWLGTWGKILPSSLHWFSLLKSVIVRAL